MRPFSHEFVVLAASDTGTDRCRSKSNRMTPQDVLFVPKVALELMQDRNGAISHTANVSLNFASPGKLCLLELIFENIVLNRCRLICSISLFF